MQVSTRAGTRAAARSWGRPSLSPILPILPSDRGRHDDWTYVLAAANRPGANPDQKSTQLLVADDHAATRQALAAWLAATDISIVAATGIDPAIVNLVRQRRPDVVLLDPTAADGAGTETLQRIMCAHPDLAVVVHSRADESVGRLRALALGASGYLSWGATRRRYLQCLRVAASGQAAWTRRDLDRILTVLATARAAGRLPALVRQFCQVGKGAACAGCLRNNAALLVRHAVGLAQHSIARAACPGNGRLPRSRLCGVGPVGASERAEFVRRAAGGVPLLTEARGCAYGRSAKK